jgi:pimeloyl-ACP methyl ester carboxylesterase
MKDLILLHGALGGKQQLERTAALLSGSYNVHTLNFEGHGGRASDNVYAIELFAENLLAYLDENGISSCYVFGYSMGGYVALKLAQLHPERIAAIVTLGTKFAWSPEIAAKETAMLNPEKIEEKVPKFAAALEELHAPLDWKEVMHKTADMMRRLGDNPALPDADLAGINTPVKLLLGSEDVMVTRDETEKVQALLPNARFEVIDGWQHPIERVAEEALADRIREELTTLG